jgi:hypothetical protein
MVENYVNSNETAFGAYNFKLTKPETYDEIPVQEEYEEPAEFIRSFLSSDLRSKSKVSTNSKNSKNARNHFSSNVSSINESIINQ